jgi:hypothetical protein
MKIIKINLTDWLEEYKIMNTILKSALLRFARTFVAGALGTMIVVVPMSSGVSDWHSLSTWLSTLALAGMVGGVSGIITSADKAIRASNSVSGTDTINSSSVQ